MEVVIADIYQKEKDKIIYGIHIEDKSKNIVSEDNIIWWLVVNIIRNQRITFVTTKGFKLDKKIFINASS